MDTISEDTILRLLKKYPGVEEKSISVEELLGNLRDFAGNSHKPTKDEILGDVPGVAFSKVMDTLANTSRLLNQKGSPMEVDKDVKDAIDPNKEMTIAFVSPIITPSIIARRIITEAIDDKERGFSVDLKSLICDKVHSKFLMKRDGTVCTVEILYPNANGKITVKMSCDGSDDVIQEIALEDDQYVNGLGNYILTILDEMIANAAKTAEEEEATRTEYTIQNPVHLGGFPNVWESVLDNGLKTVAAIMEADDDEDGGDTGSDDMNAEPVSGDDIEASFGGEGGGGDSFGDGFGGMDPSMGGANNVAAMNQDDSTPGMEVTPDKELVKFADAAMNFKQEAFDTMIRLIANYQSNVQRTSGSGVILTPNEIINGTTPLETQSNNSIVEMFLKIYPELNQDLEMVTIDEIERKLWGGADSFPAEFQLIRERIMNGGIPDFDDKLAGNDFFTIGEEPGDAGMAAMSGEPGTGEPQGGISDFGGGFDGGFGGGEPAPEGGEPAPEGGEVPGETEQQVEQNEEDEDKLDILNTSQINEIENV